MVSVSLCDDVLLSTYSFIHANFLDDVIAIRPRIGSKKLISTVGVSVAAGLDALEEKFRPFAVKTMICGSQPKKNVGAIQNITVCQANYTLSAIRCNMK